jgi:nifR3 family TIM-barrel protein
MMTELEKTAKLVRGMIDAVKIPVTAKMRLGWDDANLTAPDLVRVLEDVGVSAIFIHGRTREQGFSGTVNLAGIRAVVESARNIPVIGNGDVTTPESARHMIDQTGCAGVSIGRGAFYEPWIFRRTEHLLRTGELLPEAGFDERIRVMCRHLELMVEILGEDIGCRMYRKVAPWYAKRLGPVNDFKKRLVAIIRREDFYAALDAFRAWRVQFCGPDGQLLPRFQPSPMVATFMRDPSDPAVLHREAIPVPKGPVDVW